MASALANEVGAGVFRLRESAWRNRHRIPGLDLALRHSTDPLGWIDDRFVVPLLQEAWSGASIGGGGIMLLENFPGNAAQVSLLWSVLDAFEVDAQRMRAIELIAPDPVLDARVRSRRVCLSCEPDPRADPHFPAVESSAARGRCDRCGRRLRRRASDAKDRFEARLARYRLNRPSLVDRFGLHGVEVREVPTLGRPEAVLGKVRDALSKNLKQSR